MIKWFSSFTVAALLVTTGCSKAPQVNATEIGRTDMFAQRKIVRSQPDLTVSSVTLTPSAPTEGDLVTVSATVKNIGTAATPSGTIVGINFSNSSGTSIGFSDTNTASLAAGATVVLTSNQKWTAIKGVQTITAYVDDVNRIMESNETNNKLSISVTVAAKTSSLPDLVVTGYTVSPATPVAGDIVTFTATVQNNGSVATPAGVIIGVGFKDGAGTTIAYSDNYSTSLAGGASVNLTTNKTWTSTSGSQTVTAFADDVNRILESNETNNKLAKTVTVASSTSTTPPPAPSPTNAKPAFSFVDSIGVNTHFAFTSTPYVTSYSQVKSRLLELGVKYIRDGSGSAAGYKAGTRTSTIWNELASLGIKTNIISRTAWTNTDIIDVLNANRAAVISIEGQNEADIFLNSDWTAVRDLQKRLWATVKGSSTFSYLPVIGPSVGNPSRFQYIGDLSAYLDYGNIHSYPGGRQPLSNLSSQLTSAALVSGNKPVMSTETGYHTALQTTSSHLPISERGEGKYMPRLFFDYFNSGVVRTFDYQFFDQLAPSTTDPEANFGLVRADFSVRPAFTNLKNTIAILKDSSASIPGGTLSYTLSGATTGVRSTLLQKSDGKFYLALWHDVSVWNTSTRTDIVNPDVAVTVNFGSTKNVSLYKPSAGAGALATYSGTSINVNVPDEVIILEIQP
jgi:hypothetical protein